MTARDILAKRLTQRLAGRKIKCVRYALDDEVKAMGFHDAPVIIELDDGNIFYPLSDDEGNGPGALATTYEGFETIGVW